MNNKICTMLELAQKHLNNIIEAEFEYLRMCGFPEITSGTVEFDADGIGISHRVHRYINGELCDEGGFVSYETDLNKAIERTKQKLSEIVNGYKNICVRLYPVASCYMNYDGEIEFAIRFRVAHWND